MSSVNRVNRALLPLTFCALNAFTAAGEITATETKPATQAPVEDFVLREFSTDLVARLGISKDLTGTNGHPALAFATLHDTDEQSKESSPRNFVPVILTFDGVRWEMTETPFRGCGWQYAGRMSQGKRVYAILDNVVEAPGNDLSIIASNDGGATWKHLANVGKPWYMTQLDRFTMDEKGNGTISIFHDAREQDPSWTACGYFTAETKDWGATWSNYLLTQCDLEGGYTNRVVVLYSVKQRTTQEELKRIEEQFQKAAKESTGNTTP